ncbi:MAG: hypothetical protein LBF33_01310 [Oscillospiraceae bacterium]|jgi:hypothetical protein|nr:hypothetical protein [Oscillospiraceae bacterium]
MTKRTLVIIVFLVFCFLFPFDCCSFSFAITKEEAIRRAEEEIQEYKNQCLANCQKQIDEKAAQGREEHENLMKVVKNSEKEIKARVDALSGKVRSVRADFRTRDKILETREQDANKKRKQILSMQKDILTKKKSKDDELKFLLKEQDAYFKEKNVNEKIDLVKRDVNDRTVAFERLSQIFKRQSHRLDTRLSLLIIENWLSGPK